MSESAPARDTVLLCLDMQPVFVRAVTDGPQVQRRCEFAIAAAGGLGLPIVFTEQVPQKLGGTAAELLALSSPARVFAKETFSALAAADIRAALLDDQEVEHLLLCGIETPVCVYQTALEAVAAGLHVTILSDCIGARRNDDAAACLKVLVRAGAHVLPSETVFYSMIHDVKHPFFKAYTQLVKTHG
jgi:nicotinamidase-related amidase